VGVHECSDADYTDFYARVEKAARRFDTLRQKKAWMCIDKKDSEGNEVNQKLFGSDENTPNRRLEIIYKPCVPRVMEWHQNQTDYENKCLVERNDPTAYDKKLKEIKKWIGNPDLLLAYNLEELNLKAYGPESIHRETKVMNY